jgi:hypothetical protein
MKTKTFLGFFILAILLLIATASAEACIVNFDVFPQYENVRNTNEEFVSTIVITIRDDEGSEEFHCEEPEIWFRKEAWDETFQLTDSNVGTSGSNSINFAPATVSDDEGREKYTAEFYLEFLKVEDFTYPPGPTYAAVAAIGLSCYGQEPTWIGNYQVGGYEVPFRNYLPIFFH